MNRIRDLSPAQKAQLAEVYQEWLAAGNNCEPLNRRAVADTVAEIYYHIGRSAPRILFFSSPAMCLLAGAALATERVFWDRIQTKLTTTFAQLWGQLPAQLENQLDRLTLQEGKLRKAVETGLKGAINQLRQEVFSETQMVIRRQIDVAVLPGRSDWCRPTHGSSYYLHESLVSQILVQGNFLVGGLNNSFAVNPWAEWEALHVFCGVLRACYSPRQVVLLDLCLRSARNLHFWSPYDSIVLCAERPGPVSVDDRGRLHSPGLACAYRDGWGVAAWHGIPLPVKYHQPNSRMILSEPNVELRRMLIERYDADRGKGSFVQAAGAKLIASAVQPMRPGQPDAINELLSLDLPDDPDHRMVVLKVTDPSTGRTYMIRVPPNQTTVRGALAWTFNIEPGQYVLQQET
jgi:hypothetical protein